MSKTGEWIINTVETISEKTGYSFKFLMEQYFEIADVERVEGSPLAELEARAFAKQWGTPDESAEQTDDGDKHGEIHITLNIDTSMLEEAEKDLAEMRKSLHGIMRAAERAEHREAKQVGHAMMFDQSTGKLSYADAETSKIRKHNHDTLWAVLAGFTACAVLMSVFGLIIIGILSYARG